jgi:multimeric flavodoxin WrbA
MKATIFNGALTGDRYVDDVAEQLTATLAEDGWQVQSWTLRYEKIAYCLGCFECWTKTPGRCRIDDGGQDVAASYIQADSVFYVTSITFGSYSSALKKAVDRIICLIEPFFRQIDGETHHHARYDRYPAIRAVGVLPQPDGVQEQLFRTLVERNAINMHAPDHAVAVLYRAQTPQEQAAALSALLQERGIAA